MLFYEKAILLEMKQRQNFVTDVRAAVWAEENAFERLVDALTKK